MLLGDLPAGRVGVRVLVALLGEGARYHYLGRLPGGALQHVLHGDGLFGEFVALEAEQFGQDHVSRTGFRW